MFGDGARFGEGEWLVLVWAAAGVVVVSALGWWWRRRRLRRYAAAGMIERVAPGMSAGRAVARWVLVALGLTAGVVGLGRPQGDPREEGVSRFGRDVCFVVDVSRSMLADDLAPTRLGRTKLWIGDVLETLAGDRVAVVGMAGKPFVASPLTHDYSFVRSAVDGLGPELAPLGGTNVGDTIRMVLDDVFPESEEGGEEALSARFRDIVLITDGEETVESLPLEAAAAAAERGVRIITIGIGSDAGARVPMTDRRGNQIGWVRDGEGQIVVSRVDKNLLRQVAALTPGGVFIDVGTDDLALDTVYSGLMQEAERRELERAEGLVWEEWFQVFALAAFGLLALEMVIAERRRG